MAYPKKDRKFIDGIFLRMLWSDNNQHLIGAGIKKKEFIESISALEEDEKGFINLKIGSQKKDHAKLSMFYEVEDGDSKSSKSATTPPSSSTPVPPVDDTDDLPF